MTPIQIALIAVLALLSALWWAADTLFPQPFGYFPFRTVFMQYSGALAIGVMSVAMVLAARPVRLERPLGGLDKMYRLHKWLGITALVVSLAHWWMAQGTKWMVGWGWLTRPERRPRPPVPADAPFTLEAAFGSLRGLAEGVGEWAFYAAAILMMLALVKRFPYHLFARTHTLIAVAYLVLVFHSVVLVKFAYWGQPIGVVLAVLMAAGSVAAVLALSGRIGRHRQVDGRVTSIQDYAALDVLETRVVLGPGWPGHAAGQFAFVTSDPREGAHPYTIASAWQPAEPGITVVTKALGDHTRRLRERLHPGMPVTVEGPYGCFTFDDGRRRQVWIGAGIGITPFIARMKQLAAQPGHGQQIDLFHPTAVHEEAAIAKLRADAAAAGVRLHVLVDARDGRLSGERLRADVPDWQDASVWFCGPSAFGRALRRDLVAHGLPRARFHQELFEMR